MSRTTNAIFVALEGPDRTGKSTQASLLVNALTKLTGKPTLHLKFPDRSTKIGAEISEYLKGNGQIEDHVLHLLFTANRWERQNQLREALSQGVCVVADRYSYSGIAYTAAKPAPASSWQWCCDMEKGLIEPDLVICLTPECLEDLKSRNGYGEELYETTEYQARVLANFYRQGKMSSFQDNEADSDDGPTWHFVQATKKSIDEVHQCIMAMVTKHLDFQEPVTEVA